MTLPVRLLPLRTEVVFSEGPFSSFGPILAHAGHLYKAVSSMKGLE